MTLAEAICSRGRRTRGGKGGGEVTVPSVWDRGGLDNQTTWIGLRPRRRNLQLRASGQPIRRLPLEETWLSSFMSRIPGYGGVGGAFSGLERT